MMGLAMAIFRTEKQYNTIINILEREKIQYISMRDGIESRIQHITQEIQRLSRDREELKI